MEESTKWLNNHTSQYSLGLPLPVEKCCCGIASTIFTLRYFGINKGASNSELAIGYIKSGRYTRPVVTVAFDDFPGCSFPVLVAKGLEDYNIQEATERARAFMGVYSEGYGAKYSLQTTFFDHTKYLPAFCMEKGSDARGISHYLESRGLHTVIYEHKDGLPLAKRDSSHIILNRQNEFVSEYKKCLKSANTLLISSVTQSKFSYPDCARVMRDHRYIGTHVVVASGGSTKNRVIYADPAYSGEQDGIREIDTTKFIDALADDTREEGHFIAVWKDLE